MKKLCAYCDGDGPFTREHVWPDAFLERFGRSGAGFSVRSQRVHKAEYAVRDVCSKCNNKHLSQLDTYFVGLYDKYFAHITGLRATITFEYEYDLLARALLKIAYNSARIGLGDDGTLRKTNKYILGTTSRRPEGMVIVAELVAPYKKMVDNLTSIEIPPNMFHSAKVELKIPSRLKVLTRLITVNSYFFFLTIPKAVYSSVELQSIKNECTNLIPGTVYVSEARKSIKLNTSPQDGVRLFLPQIMANREKYRTYFNKRKSDAT